MLPTAEEFLIEFYNSIYNNRPESFKSKLSLKRYLDLCIYGRINGEEDNLSELLVKFTKLHVEAFREEIREKEKCFDFEGLESIVKDVYPLENIK